MRSGAGAPGFTGDGGRAVSALVNTPRSPHFDAAGNLYFADSGNHRIRRIDPKGIITTVAGDGIAYSSGMDFTGPATQRSLPSLTQILVSPGGNIYFLESVSDTESPSGSLQFWIEQITPGGQMQVMLNLPDQPHPYGYGNMTIDGRGNFYLTQAYTQSFDTMQYLAILKITPAGAISTVRQWTSTGNPAPPPVVLGQDMTADAAGNLYFLANVLPGGITRLDPDGSLATIAGGGQPPDFGYVSSPDGPALPSVIYPSLMAFDAHGDIVLVDSFTPVACCNVKVEIREVTAASQLVTLAGANGQIVPDGTPRGSIWFDGLSSIAYSHSGDLYVAQRTGCKIWKIGADGSFTTFAGNGTCAYPAPATNAKSGSITPPRSKQHSDGQGAG